MPENSMVSSQGVARFIYIGPGVEDGSMEIRQLAPALLAISGLVTEVDVLLNEKRTQTRVSVKAATPGSFDIAIQVDQTIVEAIKSLFTKENIATAKELVEMIAGGGGILGLVKFLNGRRPKAEKIVGNTAAVTNEKGQTITVNVNVLHMYQQPAVRSAAAEAVRPLQTNALDRLEVRVDDEPAIEITKDDVPAFSTVDRDDEAEELIADSTLAAVYTVLKPSFDSHLSFYVNDGIHNMDVFIKDRDFLADLEAGKVTFRAKDLLYTETRIVSTRGSTGILRTRREIIKVTRHEHYQRRQMTLDLPPAE